MRRTAELWDRAVEIDSTLSLGRRHLSALEERQIHPRHYSRHALFDHLAAELPVVFNDLPLAVRNEPRAASRSRHDQMLSLLRRRLPPSMTTSLQRGPSGNRVRLPIREFLRLWEGRRAVVSVTDLHFRETKLAKFIDVAPLSDFNLLLLGSNDMAEQEIMTLVVSAAGNLTDSHSDDPDGSNHCFCGLKLWLVWETFEGLAAGLEDVERVEVTTKAAFSMKTFLSLPTARWFLVSEGETLFLPGRMSHKVVTLEHYVGVGSFFVALPSCLPTLIRWYTRGPLWADDGPGNDKFRLVDEIALTAASKVRSLRRSSRSAQKRWGLSYIRRLAVNWQRVTPETKKNALLQHEPFGTLLRACQ